MGILHMYNGLKLSQFGMGHFLVNTMGLYKDKLSQLHYNYGLTLTIVLRTTL